MAVALVITVSSWWLYWVSICSLILFSTCWDLEPYCSYCWSYWIEKYYTWYVHYSWLNVWIRAEVTFIHIYLEIRGYRRYKLSAETIKYININICIIQIKKSGVFYVTQEEWIVIASLDLQLGWAPNLRTIFFLNWIYFFDSPCIK